MGNNLSGAWVLEAFQRGDVEIESLTRCMPDEVNTLLYQMDTIAPDSVNRLLIKCAELSNNPNFGLTMNERVDISMFGIFGYLLLNSSSIEDLLGYIERYYTILYSSGAFFSVKIENKMVSIQYGVNHPTRVCTRHLTEWSLGFIPYYTQSILGEIGKPLSAHFTHNAPNDLLKLKSVFGQDLHFNQAENKLFYEQSILNQPLSETSPSLLSVLRQEADQLLQSRLENDSLDKRVCILLLENIEHRNTSATDIASALNITLSTFKRKLAKENTSFRKIKDFVKNDLAKKLLLSSESNLLEIAKRTGFTDQSSFTRFFLRCNNMTPYEFRKKHLKH